MRSCKRTIVWHMTLQVLSGSVFEKLVNFIVYFLMRSTSSTPSSVIVSVVYYDNGRFMRSPLRSRAEIAFSIHGANEGGWRVTDGFAHPFDTCLPFE